MILNVIGQYKLLAKLGQGGMGAVYKALHTRLNRLVALKVLPAERLQDAAAIARFDREMRAVGALAHENIVAAHDAGEIDGTHYLVMELVDGADLGTIARDQAPLPVAEACEIIRQAALGLQHAYENNLVHRDIKPSNLMLAVGPNGPVVKILDMGLALLEEQHAEHSELTASGQIMGTLDYMAPEQACDTHTVDIRADIYSLGATLYKLLTGRVPFQGPQYTSVAKKLMALATQDPPRIDSLREDLPEELVAIIHRMLARQPEDRYDTPAELAEAITPWAAGADLATLLDSAARRQDDGEQTVQLKTLAKGAASVSVRSSVVETQSQVVPGRSRQTGSQPAAAPGNLPPRRPKRGVLLACAAVPILLGVILLSLRTPHGEIVVELADGIPAEAAKHLKIEVTGNGHVKVADASAGWTIDVAEGKYQAKLSGGADQFQLEQNQVTVIRGEKTLLKVSLKPLAEAPSREQHADTAPAPKPKAAKIWQPTPEQQAFFDHVAKLPADEQAKAVAEKLKEVSPGYDGKFEHKVKDGKVTSFTCRSEHLADIWPVRALTDLKELVYRGEAPEKRAKFFDLSPLQGLPLASLDCWFSAVADLSPLRAMLLKKLGCSFTEVSDLSPLRGMPLTYLKLTRTQVEDLTPLAGMQLTELHFNETRIKDLSPLKGMPLRRLSCGWTQVTDLSPLRGMALEYFTCGGTKVDDLSPLAGMPLVSFECRDSYVCDLSPLKGMRLKWLHIYGTPIADLSPIADMPLVLLQYDVRLFDEDDQNLIASLPLTYLNGPVATSTPVVQTLVELATQREAALTFAEATAKLSLGERIEAVTAKLEELNGPDAARLGWWPQGDANADAWVMLKGSKPVDITPLMALTQLKKLDIIGGRSNQDISCLKFLELEELNCDDWILFTNVAVLKKMRMLQRVNGYPADEYLDYVASEGLNGFAKPKLSPIPWDVTPEQQAFFDHMASLPAKQQAEAVAKKLMEVNPGYDGKFESAVANGRVATFKYITDRITQPTTDVWPIRALPALQQFWCRGSGRIQDGGTYRGNAIDLSQLRGMRLTSLSVKDTPIKDLSPLVGMRLTHLACYRTKVADLRPLRALPLEHLQYDVRLFDETDEEVLRSLSLRFVNGFAGGGQPINEFWLELAQRRDAAKAFAAETSQLSPVERVAAVQAKLDELNGADQVRLKHKLKGEHLAEVECNLADKAADLTPLMAFTDLKKLALHDGVPWQDLSCLKFLPLEELTCSEDAAYKNNGTLGAIKTLRTINGMPAQQFWQKLLEE